MFLLALWAAAPAHAAPPCVKAVEGADRSASGIAGPALETVVLVEHCGGGWSRISLVAGAVRLSPWRKTPPERTAQMLPDGG